MLNILVMVVLNYVSQQNRIFATAQISHETLSMGLSLAGRQSNVYKDVIYLANYVVLIFQVGISLSDCDDAPIQLFICSEWN